jgi:hypothetical protein
MVCTGEAVVIVTPGVRREQAESVAASPVVTDTYVLFGFQIKQLLVIEYDEESRPVVRKWRGIDTYYL